MEFLDLPPMRKGAERCVRQGRRASPTALLLLARSKVDRHPERRRFGRRRAPMLEAKRRLGVDWRRGDA